MKKTATKKPVAKNNTDASIVSYSVAIPEEALMDLLRLDCATTLDKFGKEFCDFFKTIKCEGKKYDLSGIRDTCKVASQVLNIIQDAWQETVDRISAVKGEKEVCCCKHSKAKKPQKPAKAAKAKQCKGGLSNDEIGKIRALRKRGLSIKAIGKEIHRAEKVVADFVRTMR